MKKVVIVLIMGFFAFTSLVSAATSYTTALDNVVDSMCDYRTDLPQDEQMMKYSQVVDFLIKIDSRLNPTQKKVALYIRTAFTQKLSSPASNEVSVNSDATYEIPNVDMEAVNNARLNLHNEVR
jgi:hypothetical protein